MLETVALVVYGDDHLWRKGLGKGAIYFSGMAFTDFMEKYFNVKVRDVKDAVCYCSVESGGWVLRWGATFLRHQFVVNKNKEPGQPKFLPYRESRDFLIRAVWGRVTKERDVVDTMLSILGHAYGTYGSNRDAYDRLQLFYAELLVSEDIHDNLAGVMAKRLNNDDLKRLRQLGMTVEELVSGFPSWETLQMKNVWDETYQDITLRVNEQDYEFEEWI